MIRLYNIKLTLLLTFSIFSISVFAQDEQDDSGKLPVRSPFESGILIDNPTIVSPLQGGLEFNIQHRMGYLKGGTSTLFGIYDPSKIRLAVNYGVTDKIEVGLGTSNFDKLQDLHCKIALLRQNRNGSIPISVSYYGNFSIDTRSEEEVAPVGEFKFIHRFAYFSEVMFASKFNDMLSFQIAPNFAYFNAITQGMKNYYVGLSVGGRLKVFSSGSIIGEYDQSFTKAGLVENKPNVSLGYEIGTATHCFQIFASTFDKISPQYNYAFSTNDIAKKELILGFNITIRL